MLLSPSHRGISYPPPSPTRWVRVMGILSYFLASSSPSPPAHTTWVTLISIAILLYILLWLSLVSFVMHTCHIPYPTFPCHQLSTYSFRIDINATLVPSRVPLRRGMAFSTSTKNPPLLKTRNITSQNSINWHQIPSTPTPPSPRSQQLSPGHIHKGTSLQHGMTENQLPLLQKQISHKKPLATATSTTKEGILSLQRRLSTETDV